MTVANNSFNISFIVLNTIHGIARITKGIVNNGMVQANRMLLGRCVEDNSTFQVAFKKGLVIPVLKQIISYFIRRNCAKI